MFIDTISDESTGKGNVAETIADTVGNQVAGRQKRQAEQDGPGGGLGGGFGGGPGGGPGGGIFSEDGNFPQNQVGPPDPPEVNEDFSRDADFLQLYMELSTDVRHVIGHRLSQVLTSL